MEVRRLKPDELQHHGTKGMHWGIRRYQNPDGSLTAAGRKRYGYGERLQTKIDKDYSSRKKLYKSISKADSATMTLRQEVRNKKVQNRVTNAIGGTAIGAGVANAINATKKTNAANIANAMRTSILNSNIKSAAARQALKNGTLSTFSYAAVPQVTPLVQSAVASMNPIALSVAASAAVTLTGYALYNKYKNYKISEIHDEYNVPDSKRVRSV